MSARLAWQPGARPERPAGWEALLEETIRPEFRVRVYRPKPDDAVLFGPTCIVEGCRARGLQRAKGAPGHLCAVHARAWGAADEPPQADWAKNRARGRRSDRSSRVAWRPGVGARWTHRGCAVRTTTTGSARAGRRLRSLPLTRRR